MRYSSRIYGQQMNASDALQRQAAEQFEQAACQAEAQGQQAAARCYWEQAAGAYVKARAYEPAVRCFTKAGSLADHLFELLEAFEPGEVLRLMQDRVDSEALVLGGLFLQSRGDQRQAVSTFEMCVALIETAGVERALDFVAGAVVSAALSGDDMRLSQAIELGIERLHKSGPAPQDPWPGDLIRLLAARIILSGRCALLAELGERLFPSSRASDFDGREELRWLLPVYLFRGIDLTVALRAMAGVPELQTEAKSYQGLLDGIAGGKGEEALGQFVEEIERGCCEGIGTLQRWDRVRRALRLLTCTQPAALAAAVLWDQLVVVRTGLQVLRTQVGLLSRSRLAHEAWKQAEQLVANPLLLRLPDAAQEQIARLVSRAAFVVGRWDAYDQWAQILETRHGVETVLRDLIGSLDWKRGSERLQVKLKGMRRACERLFPARSAEAAAEQGEHGRSACGYAVAADRLRGEGAYEQARRLYMRAASEYTLAEDTTSAQSARAAAQDCEAHLRECERTGVMRQHVEATRQAGEVQAQAMTAMASQHRETLTLLSSTLREAFLNASRALLSGLSILAQAQRESALASAEVVYRGLERLASSQSTGIVELARAVREGELLHALSTYAGLRGVSLQEAQAARIFCQAVSDVRAGVEVDQGGQSARNMLQLFDAVAKFVPSDRRDQAGSMPVLAARAIAAETNVTAREEVDPVIQVEPGGHCLLAQGPPGIVDTIVRKSGRYQQCRLAHGAIQRRWHEFECFSVGVLKQSGCPLPQSLNLFQRFLWRDTCPLADGRVHPLSDEPREDKRRGFGIFRKPFS